MLKGTGDVQAALDCQMQAYALYKQVQESGHRDVRREFAALMGRLGEHFWQRGAEDHARKLLAHATLLTEQLASDAALDETARRHLQATLVTRYYQLSRLSENLPDVPDASQARESLLDMTLGAGCRMYEARRTGRSYDRLHRGRDRQGIVATRSEATPKASTK